MVDVLYLDCLPKCPSVKRWVANGLLLGLNLCQSKETTSWIYTGFIIGFQVRPQRTKDAVTVFGVSCGRKLMTVPMAEFTRHGMAEFTMPSSTSRFLKSMAEPSDHSFIFESLFSYVIWICGNRNEPL